MKTSILATVAPAATSFATPPVLGITPAAAQTHCMYLNHFPGYTQIENACSRLINVRWRDQKYCASGCMEAVRPYQKHNVMLWVGNVTYCICWDYDRCCAD